MNMFSPSMSFSSIVSSIESRPSVSHLPKPSNDTRLNSSSLIETSEFTNFKSIKNKNKSKMIWYTTPITPPMTGNEKTAEEPSKILEPYSESSLMQSLQRPNTQFIKRAFQLNRYAKELSRIYQSIVDDQKMSGISSISLRTGAGFLINTDDFKNTDEKPDELVEVIDYDPVRNNMMLIGNKPPVLDVLIHWIIYRGLQYINFILVLNEPEIVDKLRKNGYAELKYDEQLLNMKLALNILENVKESKILVLTGSVVSGVILTGKTVGDVITYLTK